MKSLILLFHGIFLCTLADEKINVTIDNAVVQGYLHSYGQSFRGIPFAKAPIGKLRFAEAEFQELSEFTEALSFGKSCVQDNGKTGSEDCLYINVFAPKNATSTSKLPVYMYIFGGGFVGGDGNMNAAIYDNLVNSGPLIMVTANYRVGPFGFFSTRDTLAPGNEALTDWLVALQWVKRYIPYFGGDPSRITIGGQSAGSEAVSALTLTPVADGLFQQVIMESGSAFGAAVMSYSEKTRDTSKQLAIKLNCATEENWDSGSDFGPILNCMRGLTSQKISEADSKLPSHRMKWALVQDKKYLTERLEYLALKRKPYPVLIGNVHDEWTGWEHNMIVNHLNSSHNTPSVLNTDLAQSYEISYWANRVQILQAAQNKYVNNQGWSSDDHIDWEARRVQLWSEMIFIGPTFLDAKYFAYTKSNVWLYSFDWLSPNASPEITIPQLRGVPHAYELQYIFSDKCSGFTCAAEDNQLRVYFSRAWRNFIVTGNPTPQNSGLPFRWQTMDSSNRYLSFLPQPSMKTLFHPDSLFWVCVAPQLDGYKPPFC